MSNYNNGVDHAGDDAVSADFSADSAHSADSVDTAGTVAPDADPDRAADLSPELEAPPVPVLREPVDGVPEPVTTRAQLEAVIAGLAAGHGPLAVDAERASGYRYSQRAYLVQLRREGYGSVLIDPIAVPDLSELNDALGDTEWILHAAHQDLPCLAELGLRPARLFDTELAGRLLGEERVALGTMVERYLGVGLEKGHSAADWSTRPLPHDWLVYAALDVELLIPLRAVLVDVLAEAGKTNWAEQEFEAARTATPAPPRAEPWRRTSGIHSVRSRRQLGVIRALWQSRDELAAQRDIAPGRILPDAAIVDAARKNPKSTTELIALAIYGGSRQRRNAARWFGAVQAAALLADDDLPTVTGSASDALPPSGRWRERSPEAAARLAVGRDVISALAEQHAVLAQNLLASDTVRRLAWAPPAPAPELTEAIVAAHLATLGARSWQIAICAGPLAAALSTIDATKPVATDEPPSNS